MKTCYGNLFDSTCSTLVNTVNCVGVMGKGIALEFRKRYPDMFSDYVLKCKSGELKPGRPYLYNKGNIGILNFPTKTHWREPSELSYIISGLDWFIANYEINNISSIAFPALGCGNGGLPWNEVSQIMQEKLSSLPIEIEIYEPSYIKLY